MRTPIRNQIVLFLTSIFYTSTTNTNVNVNAFVVPLPPPPRLSHTSTSTRSNANVIRSTSRINSNDYRLIKSKKQHYHTSAFTRSSSSSSSRSSTTSLSLIPDMNSIDNLIQHMNIIPDAFTNLNLAVSNTNPEQINQIRDAIASSTLECLGQDILTFLLFTVVTIPLSKFLNVNPILTFLVVGSIIGPYNLNLFSNNEADLQLGDFGILFLLFNEGLSLSPDRIKALGEFSKLGVLQIVSSMTVFFFGTMIGGPFVLQYLTPVIPIDDGLLRPILSSPAQAFCIAAAGALSSSAFVLPVLKEKKWEDRPEGIAGLSILLLQDLAVAPLLVLIPVLAGTGPQTSAELGILIAKATVGFGGVLVLGRYVLSYVFDVVAEAKSTETFVAAALLVAAGMGVLAENLGLSASTGAFAAGVLLAGNRFRPQIQADIKPFEGILLGVFFMTAGAELDPTVVIQELPTLLIGIAAFIFTKASVLFASGPGLGLTLGESARVALTLAGGGEFSFVLFKLAQDLDVLPSDLAKLLTASVIVSMSLTPLLGEIGDKLGDYLESQDETAIVEIGDGLSSAEVEKLFDETDADSNGEICLEELRASLVKLHIPYAAIADIFTSFDANGDNVICKEEWIAGCDAGLLELALKDKAPDAEDVLDDSFSENAVVICGFGKMGRGVYKMLQSAGKIEGGIVAFSLDPSRVTAGALSGAPVIFGDGARYDLYKAAGANSPRAVLVTYASQSRRVNAVERLKASLPEGTPIYAFAENERNCAELLKVGVDQVINETTETSLQFGNLLNLDIPSENKEFLRMNKLTESTFENELSFKAIDAIPGWTEDGLSDLAEEVNLTSADLKKLYNIFSSLISDVKGDVPINELRDMMIRTSGKGPIDQETLVRCMELADENCDGNLTFEEFVRTSCLPALKD
jgi:Kef-type K+ transport system membrane component KefB/voltage-gated potassium channel Kch